MSLSQVPGQDVPFDQLGHSDLVLDAVYAGGSSGHSGDDALARLLPGTGNQEGSGTLTTGQGAVRLAVLYTSGGEVDWPDYLDIETGTFTYYGDNRTPGKGLHETPRRGNVLLRDAFDYSHGTALDRGARVPPFLLFEKARPKGRAVRFRGLLAPGGPTLASDDELAAIWRSTKGKRFQNYRSRFTVLDVERVPRSWIAHVLGGGDVLGGECPQAWKTWVQGRVYRPLLALGYNHHPLHGGPTPGRQGGEGDAGRDPAALPRAGARL